MSISGRVCSIHIHPEKAGGSMVAMPQIEVVAEKGIREDKRYFGRRSQSGQPGKRQVTLIEREQIKAHAQALGRDVFQPGEVRSNIETEGIAWVVLTGRRVRIGTAVLDIGEPRDPCHKMDELAPGLRELMDDGKQGVLAQVFASGVIRVGDEIQVLPLEQGTDRRQTVRESTA